MQPVLRKKIFLLLLLFPPMLLSISCRSISTTKKDIVYIANLKQQKMQKRELPLIKGETESSQGEELLYFSKEYPLINPRENIFRFIEPEPGKEEDPFLYGYVVLETIKIDAGRDLEEPPVFYKRELQEEEPYEWFSLETFYLNLNYAAPLWMEPTFKILKVTKNEETVTEPTVAASRLSQIVTSEPALSSTNRPDLPQPENLNTQTRLSGGIAEVLLPGLGWIYLGQQEGPVQIGYVERSYQGDNTVFRFSTDKSGDYKLNFQKQEGGRSPSRLLILGLNIIPETDSGTDAGKDPQLSSLGMERITSIQAEELLKAGKKQEALYAYLQGNEEKDLFVQERIASLARDLGEYQISADYWKKIYSQVTVPGDKERALSGYLNAILKGNLYPEITTEEIIKYLGGKDPVLLFQIAQYLEGLDNSPQAVKVYEYLVTLKNLQEKDKLLYRLGTLFERDPRIRDEKKAILYYEKLVDDYPISPYWQYAKERITYLNRYYFHIR